MQVQTITPNEGVILFGTDEKGRPHASRFPSKIAEAASSAASSMGMQVLPICTPEHRLIAAKLTPGRLYGSGKASVPFVKASLYQSLAAAAGSAAGSAPETAPAPLSSLGSPD